MLFTGAENINTTFLSILASLLDFDSRNNPSWPKHWFWFLGPGPLLGLLKNLMSYGSIATAFNIFFQLQNNWFDMV
jgi:hypothetical protein